MSIENFTQPNKNDYVDFFTERAVPNPVAVTLTLKQRAESSIYCGQYEPKLDRIGISQNTRHFLNRLNQRVYGKGFTRYNKRLSVISVVEGNQFIRLHIHMVIEKPEHLNFEQFKELIEETWSKTKYGYKDNKIKPIYDYIGWIDYMIKTYSKSEGIQSSVDLDNVYLH